MAVKKTYLNWKGETIVNCEKGAGYCNKPEHYTTRQHEAALKRNAKYMSELPDTLTLEDVDSDGDGYISYQDYTSHRPENIAEEGKNRGTTLEEIPIPEGQHYTKFIEGASEAGFKIFKPEHIYNEDKSVQLEKRLPEEEGKILIRITDRYDKTLEGSIARERWGEKMHHTSISAWFVGDVPAGYANSEHALHVDNQNINSDTSFDYDWFVTASGTCDGCGKNVGRKNLEHVAFANNFCHDCAPKAREEMETPGWYN